MTDRIGAVALAHRLLASGAVDAHYTDRDADAARRVRQAINHDGTVTVAGGGVVAAPRQTALPPAASAYHGRIVLVSILNMDDRLAVCIRLASGAYAWRFATLTA